MKNEKSIFLADSPGIVDVPGFSASGVHCDIRGKNDGRLDLAWIFSETPCEAAGVFTVNRVRAAPVRYCEEALDDGAPIHGIVANSGNANACTGAEGLTDARKMAEVAGAASGKPANSIFICSTGRIGERLPMDRIEPAIREAARAKSRSEEGGRAAAAAILTSDTRAKSATARFEWDGKTVTVAGIAKGAGMIQPNMATMLAFIATDAAAGRGFLKEALLRVTRGTFNAITVDGDMSTNDTVLLLANGESGVSIENSSGAAALFEGALYQVCNYLAEKIVSDGEKISRVVEVKVEGAHSEEDAEKAARAIGNSLLVKTSWYGGDPNWGRLADAAGYSGADFDGESLDIFYEDVPAVREGTPVSENKPKWKEIVSRKRFGITLNLNNGEGAFRLLATDLTEDYVRFNKSE